MLSLQPGESATFPLAATFHLPRPSEWVHHGTDGSGSCFFHSLAFALDFKGYQHQRPPKRKEIGTQFRLLLGKEATENSWKMFMDHYHLQTNVSEGQPYFARPQYCANEPMILFAAFLCKLNVIFLDVAQEKYYCLPRLHCFTWPTSLLLWVDNEHFEPLSWKGTSVFTPDHPLLSSIQTAYEQQCGKGSCEPSLHSECRRYLFGKTNHTRTEQCK